MKVVRILVANIIGLWVAALLVSGFIVSGDWKGLAIGGVFLGILNLLIKPILRFISAPVVWLTLGFFILVINGFLIWIVAHFSTYVSYSNWTALLLATIVITIVNFIANGFKA